MNDKAALLGQLKIEHEARSSGGGIPGWVWGAGVAVLAAAAGAYWLLGGEKPVPVSVVTAQLLSSGSAGGSVLDASGYVVARRQATVSSKVTGKVTEVLIEEGQRVKAGEVLARIDDVNSRAQLDLARSQLEAAKAQLAEVQVQLADAERQLTRTRDLAEKKLVSQQQLDSAQAQADALKARLASTQSNVTVAERSVEVQARFLDDAVVRAPFDGVITVKNAQPGEMISPLSAGGAGTRTGIGTLVDMDSLEVEVDVNENFIVRVQPGQPVTAKLNAYPDWEIPAEVIAVIPTADRSKATVKVRVGFKQKDARILPDMGVRVSFMERASAQPSADRPRGVTVPPQAVQASGETGVVYLMRGEAGGQTVERRELRLGGQHGGSILVLSGLEGGEPLAVVSDWNQLADGKRVKVAEGE